ncbi:hypothetical protein GOP47_0026906 [Adiantum capillus-veneris]|nr:hypothetical protein GOP47_0026906 [Adiantum capillus-veneris]
MAWRAHLPEGWTITRYLGSGKTSNVYEADRGGGNGCVALKVFKRGYAEHGDDARYLNELQGVDGVPRVIECSTEGSMLVMEPAGEAFEASAIGQDLPLADLVDVLQNAHVLNIVNRDVCQENIMVAKSLKTGKLRMFIHDWGFAEKSDCKSGHFCRSILSAFGDMLQQYMQGVTGFEPCIYSAAVDPLKNLRKQQYWLHKSSIDRKSLMTSQKQRVFLFKVDEFHVST